MVKNVKDRVLYAPDLKTFSQGSMPPNLYKSGVAFKKICKDQYFKTFFHNVLLEVYPRRMFSYTIIIFTQTINIVFYFLKTTLHHNVLPKSYKITIFNNNNKKDACTF